MYKPRISAEKIKKWIKRYGPAEIVCTTTALISANITYFFTRDGILTAVAGTWGENIGFYATIAARDIYSDRKDHKASGPNYTFISFFKTIKDLVLEFGPAEILDSFLSRPFMMYIFPIITGNIQTGIFLGKIAADIIVYIPIIISYELQQIHKNRQKQ